MLMPLIYTDYKNINGTYYRETTKMEIIETLEYVRKLGIRVKITHNTENSEYKETGCIGRSMGPLKVPILLYNKRSIGGYCITTDDIKKIEYANKKQGGILYTSLN